MNSDQLRELADRLQPMAAAPGFDGLDIPALCDYLRQCADQRLSEPLQMLCATHYCKDCAALWRQHDDRSFSLCSQTYCMACNNTPIGGQLFALTTPVAAVPQPAQPQPEPSAGQIEAAAYERAAQECEKYAGAIDGDYNRRVMAASAAIRALAAKEQT